MQYDLLDTRLDFFGSQREEHEFGPWEQSQAEQLKLKKKFQELNLDAKDISLSFKQDSTLHSVKLNKKRMQSRQELQQVSKTVNTQDDYRNINELPIKKKSFIAHSQRKLLSRVESSIQQSSQEFQIQTESINIHSTSQHQQLQQQQQKQQLEEQQQHQNKEQQIQRKSPIREVKISNLHNHQHQQQSYRQVFPQLQNYSPLELKKINIQVSMPTAESQVETVNTTHRQNVTPSSKNLLNIQIDNTQKKQRKRSRVNLQNILNISKLTSNHRDSLLNDYQVILQRLAEKQNEYNLKKKMEQQHQQNENNHSQHTLPIQEQKNFLLRLPPETKVTNSQSCSNSPDVTQRTIILKKRENKYSVEKHQLLNNSQIELDKFNTERNERLDKISRNVDHSLEKQLMVAAKYKDSLKFTYNTANNNNNYNIFKLPQKRF